MNEKKRKEILEILNSARDKSPSEQQSAIKKVAKIIEDIIKHEPTGRMD